MAKKANVVSKTGKKVAPKSASPVVKKVAPKVTKSITAAKPKAAKTTTAKPVKKAAVKKLVAAKPVEKKKTVKAAGSKATPITKAVKAKKVVVAETKPVKKAAAVKPVAAAKPVPAPVPVKKAAPVKPVAPAPVATPAPVTPKAKPVTKRYSKEELEHFKQIILEKQSEAIANLQTFRDQMLDPSTGEYINENSPYSLHMAEQGTDAMEKEKTYFYAQREQKLLGYLEEALKRIEAGTYGLCIDCIDDPKMLCPTCPLIPRERLEAVPHSQLCAQIKKQQEKPRR
ncbi:MAG: conjugal transfer protein TraR [Ignavibacteria bacterium]|nr:conjugal transfer protein TraR [Ignavibacteria bacterium]